MATYLEASCAFSIPLSPFSSLPPSPAPLSKVHFLTDTKALTSSGNALIVSELLGTTDEPDEFLFSQTGRGVSAFAYSQKLKRAAYSARRLKPEISIVRWPGEKEEKVCTIQG